MEENSDLVNWISQALQNENLGNYKIDFGGTSGKTDGYLGDINFVKVSNGKKDIHLVIKNGKTGKNLREIIPIELYFKQEIHIYQTIIPTFKKFQLEKGIQEIFNSVPKCFKTIIQPETEVIVLENLKVGGYELHNSRIPLNVNHLNKILEQYGQFHALSFALRDQRLQEFDNIIRGLSDVVRTQLTTPAFYDILLRLYDDLLLIFKERNENKLCEELQQLLKKNVITETLKILNVETGYKVITHGDGWNNNYMFLYEGSDKSSPSKLALLDWQMSTVRNSPVFDISHFLYCCASPEDLNNLEDLLASYYASFSKHLTALGSDPENLFSFSDLKQHWKKFCLYGSVYATYIMKQSYWEATDAPDLSEMFDKDEEVNLTNMVGNIIIKDELYYQRLLAVQKNVFFYEWKK